AGVSVTANGGSAGDTFNVGNANLLDGIQGALTLTGGGGTDTANLSDQASTATYTYTVTNATVSRAGIAPVSYSGMPTLLLNGSSGCAYNVEGTAAGTATTVNAGGGNDSFNLTPTSQNFGNLQGALTLSGGGGTNTLAVSDQADTAGDTYSISTGSIQRTGT